MAVTSNTYVVGGSNQAGPYSYAFPIIADADIRVSVNGVVKTVTTHYTLDSSNTRITFTSGNHPSTGDKVIVYRDTDEDPINSTFVSGSTIRSNELNDNFSQLLYIAQESDGQSLSKLGGVMEGNLGLGLQNNLYFEGSVDDAYETTLTVANPTADRTITLPDITGTLVTRSDTGTVTSTMIQDGTIGNGDIQNTTITGGKLVNSTITTTQLANDAVTAQKIAADSIIGEKIADNAIDSEHYTDGSIDSVHLSANSVIASKIAADSIIGDKIADNAIDSEHYTDGSIDTVHIGNAQVTYAKLAADAVNGNIIADDSINSEHYVDGSIDTAHIGDSQVTHAKLAADAVNGNIIADNSINSEHYVDGSIDTEHLSANAVTAGKIAADSIIGSKIADNAIDSEHYVDGSIDTVHIAGLAVTADKLADNTIINSKIAANTIEASSLQNGCVTDGKIATDAVRTVKIQDNAVTTAKIPDNAITTAKIADAELTTLAGMESGTASILAGSTALTSTLTELNLLDGKSVVTTIGGSATDAQLPSAQAVNERIVELVTEVGGFHPIANETSFPSTNPDINDGAGTIVSIKALSSAIVCGSGVTTKTIANGAGSGNTVTINGLAQNTTYPAGRGMLVETTSTLHTYTYHRLTLDESGVADAQTAITDFNARYRVASSAPSSSLDDGDLYFDTNVNKMKVYNASSSSWDDVAAPGDFYISTFSESFDGSRTAFTVSNAPTSAQQLFISINGVIQKPNAGTGQPSEGFTLSSSTVTFSSAPATGSDYFAVVMGSSVNIGTPSNNTVSTAKIQNLAVDTAQLAADAVEGSKIADDAVGAEHIEVLDANLQLADNAKIQIGTGNDLEIFHNGTNSIIHDTTSSNLNVKTSRFTVLNEADNEHMLKCQEDGAVELYYNGVKKFESTSAGVEIHGTLQMDDNQIARFGNDGDLQIYHTGAESRISDRGGAGALFIESNDQVAIRQNDASHYMAKFNVSGSTELYHNNVKKFETQSTGAKVTGDLRFADNGTAIFGDGDDSQIKFTGTNTTFTSAGKIQLYPDGDLEILDNSSGEVRAKFRDNAGVELYHNNIVNFETNGTGITVYGPEGGDAYIYLHADEGDDDADKWRFQAYSSSSKLILQNKASGGWESNFEAIGNGAVKLDYDNSTKFETTSLGSKVTGGLEIEAGTTNHTGDASLYVHKTTSSDWGIILECNNTEYGLKVNAVNTADYAIAVRDTTNSNHPFRVEGSGVMHSKDHLPIGNNSYDLGTSSYRWRNIYTNDLHLSNEGSANSVDGTWGNYTIQEGEDDLFLINKRNGKKYKFNLTEVS